MHSVPAMVMKKLVAPYIAAADWTPAVMQVAAWGEELVAIIHCLLEDKRQMKDEIAVLKGEKKRPVFKPSRMNEDAGRVAQLDLAQATRALPNQH